jgi:hypothetical protein
MNHINMPYFFEISHTSNILTYIDVISENKVFGIGLVVCSHTELIAGMANKSTMKR